MMLLVKKFHLARNAILCASDNASLYPCISSKTSDTASCDYPFLLINHVHNIYLEGEGHIDAGAQSVGSSSMYNITIENMDLHSTSAAIKVNDFEANSTGDMYNMIFRNIRVIDTNHSLCVAPRWGTGITSNLLFE
ncbi:unnamed protein product [Rotaria sordida]|uniref:Uncharacterized protein n=1 Tax=Rotaria sordida TaxID=392033 RepID=A0A814YUQ5_9BILA|nr:unnamed protein product [Rotaria sordida]CAF1235968.1 unnamed protein product [Rotaria sordida]